MVVCLSSFMAHTDVLKRAGGFDPQLLYSQDSELMFRIAMSTEVCYVNRPLVWFDRSPAESRHVGVSSEWNKLDFFLKDSQLRLEGLLRFEKHVPSAVQKVIREELSSIHSGWANWFLEAGQHQKARAAINRAIRTNFTLNLAAKWLLTWMSPRLALRTVRHHQKRRDLMQTV